MYDRISKELDFTNFKEVEKFLDELKRVSEIFLSIEKPSQMETNDDKELNKYINNINILKEWNSTQYKPLIMSMCLKKFKLEDINIILEKIKTLYLRNIFFKNESPNTLENFYITISNEIYLDKLKTVKDIKIKINNKIVNDKELKGYFLEKKIIQSQNNRIKFILKEIYNFMFSEIKINDDSKIIELEHILPKKPKDGSKWLEIFLDDEERDIYTYKIGNLTLLLDEYNKKASNYDFEGKKNIYVNSRIPENQKISELKIWNKESIEKRSEELYEQFIKRWPKN